MSGYTINKGYNRFSGNIDHVVINGGICYIQGKVNHITENGGIVYDQRQGNRIEYKTDIISEQERKRYLSEIGELKNRVSSLENERNMLRSKLTKKTNDCEDSHDEQENIPSDDVLLSRIKHLKKELGKQRQEFQQQIDDMQYRLDGAIEVNARLRANIHHIDVDKRETEICEKHIDLLATLLALYPYTPTEDLYIEFGLPRDKIKYIAKLLGILKTKEARDEAVEYLRKQDRQLIERRGGRHQPTK